MIRGLFFTLWMLVGSLSVWAGEELGAREERPLVNEVADTIGNAGHLRAFFKQLEALESKKQQKVNIVHIGDSHIQADFFTGEMRKLFQEDFGDGGIGLTFPYNLAKTNGPKQVRFKSNISWTSKRNSRSKPVQETGVSGHGIKTPSDYYQINLNLADSAAGFDRLWVFYEPGNHTYDLKVGQPKPGASTERKFIPTPEKVYHTVRSGESLYSIGRKYGVSVSKIQSWNNLGSKSLIRPKQKLVVKNGEHPSAVDRIKADDMQWAAVDRQIFPLGMQVFEWDQPQQAAIVQGFKKGDAQKYANLTGFYVEDSQASGIVYSAIGSNGAKYLDYNKYNLFFEQLGELPADLYIFSMGTNECFAPTYSLKDVERDVLDFIHRVRKKHPNAPILLTTPADSYTGRGRNRKFNPRVEQVRDVIIEVAQKEQVAYWDWWRVMGGANGISNWKKQGFSRDYVHFSADGYRLQGEMLYEALMRAYQKSRIGEELPIKGLHSPQTMPAKIPFEGKMEQVDQNALSGYWIDQEAQVMTAGCFSSGSLAALNPKFFSDIFQYQKKAPLLFNSGVFFVLFLIFYAIYLKWEKVQTFRVVYVTLFSLFFYYKSSGFYFIILIFSSIVDYYLGNKIYEEEDDKKRKLYLLASVVCNLGILGYFKYTNFFINSINGLTGAEIGSLDIFLPIGISFYTFQTMSYSIDLYRRSMKPAESFWDFTFFVTFFPQLVAGPIVRAADFIPQIHQKLSLSKKDMSLAFSLIIGGLIKKAIISDYISINFVDRVFNAPALYSGFENLMAVYGYAIQIYCDFSGYSDMAIGIALLMGFRLPVNFQTPYNSGSITEFWRRWHISLSSWLRDYLYIPLGGNQKGKVRTYVNLMLTMLLGGLWHGASWNFVLWGALHGGILGIERLLKGRFQFPKSDAWRFLGQVYTFHFVCLAWIFFRAANFEDASLLINRIMTDTAFGQIPQVLMGYKEVFALMFLGYATHWAPKNVGTTVNRIFYRFPLWGRALTMAVVIWCIWQVSSSEVHPFIYFQF
ncbi:MBOAT family O-acyltransferase [Persicobacter sp. CCB-QB2]|uniref:MBOAT family O-acyltransferase n=1 Tax=Persicobacter sp. CCB-QB2 TaxID=1561025 RepID=UPI0009E33B73|nr:MBOAT family O-acyltransferase [Persicobacter sp. CCB-QB2]